MINISINKRKQSHYFTRYLRIAQVLAKYKLGELLRYVGMQKYLVLLWILYGKPWRKMIYTKPQRIRIAIEELGTSFVKLGQIMSTRTDLLPLSYTEELSKLQSSLSPLPIDIIQKVISDELGHSTDKLFSAFDPLPLGVASIGQVYSCTSTTGTELVIKVQKPGVQEIIDKDMYILNRSAVHATKHQKWAQQYDLVGIVKEISDTIKLETDYIREAYSAEYFAHFFQKDPTIHIPKIIWESTTSRVLTMERIHGIGILDIQALDKSGFDRKELAKRSVNLWLKMIFEGESFHADPHPGNIFVEPDGRLGLVDFGMVSLVDDEVRWNLANACKAIVDLNVDSLIDALTELGAVNVLQGNSRSSLRKDLKSIMIPYRSSHLHECTESVCYDIGNLFSVLRHNQIKLPANTFLLLKTIIMAQSLGRRLDPEFDIIPMLRTNVTRIYKKKYSFTTALKRIPTATAELAILAAGLPKRFDKIMKTVERGDIQVRTDVSGVEQHLHHLERLVNRAIVAGLIATFIIALALFFVGYQMGN